MSINNCPKIYRIRRMLAIGLVVGVAGMAGALVAEAGAGFCSPVALMSDGGTSLCLADETGRAILEYATESGQVIRTLGLPITPTGLVKDAGSDRLFIAGGGDSGVVLEVDWPAGEVGAIIPVGHTPMSPVMHGSDLYVCNRFSNSISKIDLNTRQETTRIAVGREPVALALTPDGMRLVVVHHLPEGPANDGFTSLTVAIIDTQTNGVIHTLPIYDGASGGRGVCVSPDGAYAYVTHLVGRYKMPTNQLERGWMWNNALSIIDIGAGQKVNTVLLDDIYAGSANPWAVACSADGAALCVTHAGSMEVSVIDRAGLHARLAAVANGIGVPGGFSNSAADVPNDLGFLAGLRKRVPLAGNGPRSLALMGNRAYVGGYFSETIESFDFTEDYPKPVAVTLGSGTPPTAARLGEQYFNDGGTCYQKWLSCASCHPDGRMDGLNWDLMNDGMGSPRNVKSLLLSHYSAPAMVTGIRANAEVAVSAGFKFIQFMSVPAEKEAAVNAYLRSMRPVASPYLDRGNYSESAKRGRQLFFGAAQCGNCHQGDLYIDPSARGDYKSENLYEVGTNRPGDSRPLDVPTLAEVWRTAPYLQNGAAATIHEVLTRYNSTDLHGHTSGLSQQELGDLETFVLSIGKALYTSEPIAADITGAGGEADGVVDSLDLAAFTTDWIAGGGGLFGSRADIGGPGGGRDYVVDWFDLMGVSKAWLFRYQP